MPGGQGKKGQTDVIGRHSTQALRVCSLCLRKCCLQCRSWTGQTRALHAFRHVCPVDWSMDFALWFRPSDHVRKASQLGEEVRQANVDRPCFRGLACRNEQFLLWWQDQPTWPQWPQHCALAHCHSSRSPGHTLGPGRGWSGGGLCSWEGSSGSSYYSFPVLREKMTDW